MSQLSNMLLQGGSTRVFQPSIGRQVEPVNGKIFVLGDGENITTSASGNTIFGALNSEITIASAGIDNVVILGNTINSVTGNDLKISPVGIGKIIISYASPGTVPLLDDASQITPSSVLTDGQVIIGRTGNTPVAANLTAGRGITISNGPGSITISADGSTSGNAGALQWSIQTWMGSGNRTYTVRPNNGYIANSTIGTFDSGFQSYCPSSPINYNFAPSSEWKIGDVLWLANRNKGNFRAQMQPDQGWAYATLSGGNTQGSVDRPLYNSCVSSGALDFAVPSGAFRSYTRNYGVSLLVFIGSINVTTQNADSNGNVIYNQYNNVFFLANTMGYPSPCNINCLQ